MQQRPKRVYHSSADAPPPRKNRGRTIAITLVSILLLVGIAVGVGFVFWGDRFGADLFREPGSSSLAQASSMPAVLPPSSSSVPQPQPTEHRIRFAAVGDNLIHSAVYNSARAEAGGEGYDFTYCYAGIKYFFEDFDINWINQETLVNDELEASTYPTFSTPGACGQAAYDAGFRVFAMSNNHTYDKLAAGVSATLRYWEGMPEDVVYYGLYTDKETAEGIKLQEMNGLSIAYVAFTYGTNGIPTPAGTEAFVIYTEELQAMETKVRLARQMADVVVVSAHWGTENSHTIHPSQRELGAKFANWGADVIIGTHPHVIQDLEWIESEEDGRRVLLIHSLGNFLSAQSEPNQLVGLVVSFDIVQTEYPDGTRSALLVENVQARPTVTQYERPAMGYYDHPRTFLFRDYTDEMAAEHYVRVNKTGAWSRNYIQEMCEKYISPEFLVLE